MYSTINRFKHFLKGSRTNFINHLNVFKVCYYVSPRGDIRFEEVKKYYVFQLQKTISHNSYFVENRNN